MVGSYFSTKIPWTNCTVRADLPTPPEPKTTILYSRIFVCNGRLEAGISFCKGSNNRVVKIRINGWSFFDPAETLQTSGGFAANWVNKRVILEDSCFREWHWRIFNGASNFFWKPINSAGNSLSNGITNVKLYFINPSSLSKVPLARCQ